MRWVGKICDIQPIWCCQSEIVAPSGEYKYKYKKFELILTRRAKAYSNSSLQTVSISSHFVAVHSWSVRCSRRLQKSIKISYFGSLGSFKVINVDTTEKLVTSACCDRQHAHAYPQLFSRRTGQQR